MVLVLGLGLVLESIGQCIQVFTNTSSAQTFTVPAGVTSITVEAWGGGGRGGRRTTTGNSGGGGGGAYSRSVISVIPGQSYSFVVGAGSSTTSAGGTSRFYLNSGSDLVRALGGNSSGENSGLGATGGLASGGVGDVRYSGGKGADGVSNGGGGGGSSSGSGSNGNNASGTNGAVPPIDGGRGGDGAVEDNAGNGEVPGGGGGGGRRYFVFIFPITLTSGNGADGQIRITYTVSAGTLSGNPAVCEGGNSTFSSTVSGGTWTSNSGVATIHPTTGVITGVSPGTATITYTIPGIGICPNTTVSRTVTVTSPPNAGTLSGNQTVCIGGNSTFTSTTTGGSWLSNNTAVATINSTTGVITGVAAGTAIITYSVPGTGGCANATTTRSVTVTAAPTAGTLSGIQTICTGGTSTFSSTISGGTWSSSNPSVATINSSTGVITGVAAGTAILTYTVAGTGGCANATATRTITVNQTPTLSSSLTSTRCSNISGTYTATSATPGTTFSWTRAAVPGISNAATSGTTAAANETLINTTANPINVVYAYTLTANGCSNTQNVTVTVNPTPTLISPLTATRCSKVSSTYTATSATAGTIFSWTRAAVAGISNAAGSGSTAAATETLINTTTSPVNVIYTYTLTANGCSNTQNVTVTVNPTPTLSSPLTATRCSNIPGTYTATSATAGTIFSWTRAAVPGISNAAASGTTAAANETLINTTANPINVVYAYTLTANGCSNTQNVTVNVNPTPTLSSPLTATRCSNVPGTYTATSATPGTTFSWTRAAVAGISNAAGSGSTAAATETLINTATNPINVVYSYTLMANGCSSTQNVTVTVNPTTVITTQPSTASYEVCFGDGFSPISVAATGTNLTYQWYSNSTNSNTGGTLINGATSSSFTPISTPVGVNYYYVLVKGACGEATSQVSGRYEVTPPVTTFTTNLDNTPQTICVGQSFSPISVVATGANLSYQWYRNTTASNSGGTLIPNETSASFTPPSNVFGPVYYYAVASSDCGTVPSAVSGAFAITNATSAAPNQTVCINEPLSPAITHTTTGATGIGTPSGLPPGVSASWANGVITISGTPTSQTGNPFNYSIPLIGGCGTVVATGTITVNPKSAISPMTRAVCSGDAFAFTPVNGTDGVVLPGTTYTWSAPSVTGGLTGGMAGNGTSISGSLNNPTNIPQTATYTVTPTSSANCTGPPFTLTVTVNPKPAIPAQSTAACSGAAFTVSPVNGSGTIVPTNTRYRWTVADNPNVIGETNQTTLQASISQTLSNSTNVPQTVVYTATPTSGAAGNCVGPPFTVTVTVNPRPVVSPITTTSCSGDAFSVTPANGTNGIVPAGTTYTWTVTDNTNVSGETNQTIPQGNISQTLTNNSLLVQSVVYTVTPRTGSCTGAPFNVTVNVNPTPVVNTVADQTLCNNSNTTAVNFSGNNVAGITYNWTNNTPSIGLPASGTGNIPSFTAKNTGSNPVTATITVTPVANGCPGLPKTFTITVNPTPVITIIPAYCTPTGSVELTAISNVPGTTWSWNTSPVKTTSTIEVDIAGNYTVTGTTPEGCVSTQSISVAQELVVNGDFTAGKTNSFTSGYFYQADVAGNNELWDDTANNGTNGYGIGTNGQNYHPNFWGIDHTNNTVGPRNMMIFNGHGNLTVWQQTVNVRPNTDYYFSAWAMSINNAGNYAKLRFEVNGVQVGTIANLTAGPTSAAQANANNYWVRFHSGSLPGGNWNSGSLSGPITIRIVNLEPALSGNDFAIDDISFGTLSPFIVLTSAPGTDDSQVVCENSPITDISYSAGSGSAGPLVQGLPPGVTSSWNGVTLRFSGTPTTAGTFNYTIQTTGSCPNPATATGTIIVKATPSAGAIAGNQTICNGQDPAPLTSVTAGTGDGIISYRWESNTNLTTPTWTTVTGNSTGATYDPPILSATTQFRRITIATSGGVACESAPTATIQVTVQRVPTAGAISASQVVCSGGDPVVFTSTTSGTGDGSITYRWERAISPFNIWSAVSGETSSTYDVPSGLATTTRYRRITVSTLNGVACQSVPTQSVEVKVNPTPTPGQIAASQAICSGGDPAPFTSPNAGTGTGIISYRWERAISPFTSWSAIPGATSPTYDPPSGLTVPTRYRRITIATSGSVACESAPTNQVEVSITPNNAVTSAAPQTVCINTPISTIIHTTTGATGIVPENSSVDYNLPNGVTANWNAGIITISGTPTEEGIFNYSIPLTGGCGTAIANGTITSTNSSYPITRISVVNPPLGAPTPATSTFTVYSAGLTPGNYVVNYSTSGVNEGPDQTITVTVITPGEFTFTSLPYTEEGTTLLTINSIQRGTDVCPYFPPNNTVPYGIGCSSEFLEEDGNDIFYVPANISQVTIQLFGDGAGGNTVTKTMEVLPGGGIFVVFLGTDIFVTEVPPSEPLADRLAQAILHTTGPNGRVVFNYTCSSLPPCASQLDNGSQYTDSEGFTILRFDYVGPCFWQAPDGLDEFEVLVVGGGGGGGFGSAAGGGGAGDVVYQRYTDITMGGGIGLQDAVFPLFVGNQGAGSTTEIQGGNGEGSTFNGPAFTYSGGNTFTGLSASGGGGGGSSSTNPSIRLGADGASGGGGAASGTIESAGGGGFAGNNGGSGLGETFGSTGAGGGGSGEAGQSGIYNAANQLLIGGTGGNGTERSISGEPIFYGAGGGGTSSGALNNQAGPGGSPYPEPNGTTLYAGGSATNNGIGQSATTYGSGGGAGRLGGGTGFPGVVYIRFPNYRILPVEYLYFNAKYNQTSRSGDLTWATAKEWENDRFEIERAVNNIKEWETIGQKSGAGYSDLPVEYEYADTNLPAAGGNIFYRLKQFDFEGNFTYSETRSIKVEPLPGTSHWIVYPNPTTGDPINLELLDDGTYNDGPVTVRIILATGQFGVIESNNLSTLSDQVSDWLFEKAAGVYTLEISWEDKKEYHKVILRR